MQPSTLIDGTKYPHVRALVEHFDLSFADVRGMLQLPRPDVGIKPGCNFAIVTMLCNVLSAISVTIYKQQPDNQQSKCGSAKAFRDLLNDFFPYKPAAIGAKDFADDLYQFARNPLAHAAGLQTIQSRSIVYQRVLHHTHPDQGWTDQELTDLETKRFKHPDPGVSVSSTAWTVNCDPFYIDVLELMRKLASDTPQMQAAEDRIKNGIPVWRKD